MTFIGFWCVWDKNGTVEVLDGACASLRSSTALVFSLVEDLMLVPGVASMRLSRINPCSRTLMAVIVAPSQIFLALLLVNEKHSQGSVKFPKFSKIIFNEKI